MSFHVFLKHAGEQAQEESAIRRVTLPKNTYLYKAPEKPNTIFLLEKGLVKIGAHTAEGEEMLYDVLHEGAFFGNLRFLDGQFSEFAKTLTAVDCLQVDLLFFKQQVCEVPALAAWFQESLVRRWCRMETRLQQLCHLSPLEKLSFIGEHLKSPFQKNQPAAQEILPLLSAVELAQLTGLSRQTIAKWQKKRLSEDSPLELSIKLCAERAAIETLAEREIRRKC
ncbi:Crp/Fnr family transcriptional regulator [Nitritalea halalkaliphila LW7]|uniref:Crp/Fnr family transcriptional regulator n=2 Tax=Nitritalea TaxID=1187887 RepID=I5C0U9_9BACT|nr:Crp/Fnr family transcriptional regulator [Nitritalea halalkaliphila LW7]